MHRRVLKVYGIAHPSNYMDQRIREESIAPDPFERYAKCNKDRNNNEQSDQLRLPQDKHPNNCKPRCQRCKVPRKELPGLKDEFRQANVEKKETDRKIFRSS